MRVAWAKPAVEPSAEAALTWEVGQAWLALVILAAALPMKACQIVVSAEIRMTAPEVEQETLIRAVEAAVESFTNTL